MRICLLVICFLCLPGFQACAKSPSPLTAQQETQPSVSALFEKIRKDEALLQYFFSQMPKGGDLHNHLTGSVYAETYFAIAMKDSMHLDTLSHALYSKSDTAKHKSSVQLMPGMSSEHSYRLRCIDNWSARNFSVHRQTTPPDEFFFAAFGAFGAAATENYLADFLKELRLRAKAENVQYLEIMLTSPKIYNELAEKYNKQNENLIMLIQSKKEQEFEAALGNLFAEFEKDASLQKNLKEYIELIERVDKASLLDDSLDVYYQTYASRNSKDPIKVFAQLYAGFKSAERQGRIAGVNIVQAENGDYSLRDYWGHMRMFKYLKQAVSKQGAPINTSMHAGELRLGLTPPEDLQFHITDAVTVAGAKRIGHGTDIAFETNAPSTLSQMAEKKIAVEINLSSNEFILNVKGSEHPIMLYHKSKVPIVLSTDDPGILRTNLSQQYAIAALRYPELKYEDFKQFALNSITYSFMPESEKSRNYSALVKRLEVFEAEIAKQLK